MRPMTRPEDTPAVAKRREREKRTISQMVALYCSDHHRDADRTDRAFCGEPVCPECLALDEYCVKRTERCRSMARKTSCEQCGNHCYGHRQQEEIRKVMRYAGPRMILHHPMAAIRHLMGK